MAQSTGTVRAATVPTSVATSGGAAALPTFASLGRPTFRWFYLAMLAQMAAMNMQLIVRGYVVFEITHSFTALGGIALASSMPMLALSIFGGVLADRLPKKTVLQAGQLVSVLNALVMGVLLLSGAVELWHLFLASLAQGTTMALMMPARQAMIPEVVSRDLLMNAVRAQLRGHEPHAPAGAGGGRLPHLGDGRGRDGRGPRLPGHGGALLPRRAHARTRTPRRCRLLRLARGRAGRSARWLRLCTPRRDHPRGAGRGLPLRLPRHALPPAAARLRRRGARGRPRRARPAHGGERRGRARRGARHRFPARTAAGPAPAGERDPAWRGADCLLGFERVLVRCGGHGVRGDRHGGGGRPSARSSCTTTSRTSSAGA